MCQIRSNFAVTGFTSGSVAKSASLFCQFSEKHGSAPISSSPPSRPATLFIFIFRSRLHQTTCKLQLIEPEQCCAPNGIDKGQSHRVIPGLSVILILAVSAQRSGWRWPPAPRCSPAPAVSCSQALQPGSWVVWGRHERMLCTVYLPLVPQTFLLEASELLQ